jgi:hypothetical protein
MLLRLPNDLLDLVCEFVGAMDCIGLPVCTRFKESSWRLMNRKLAALNRTRGKVPDAIMKPFSFLFHPSWHFRKPGLLNSYFDTHITDIDFVRWLMLNNFTDKADMPEWFPVDMAYTKCILHPIGLRDCIPDIRALSSKSAFYNPISGKMEHKQNLLFYRSVLTTQGVIICPGGISRRNAQLTIFFRYPYAASRTGYRVMRMEIIANYREGELRHRYELFM